jgi:ketosteroid isomerase-like protein
MDQQQAADFARDWAAAWNAHDLDALLAHFTEDVVFSSPVAALLVPDSGGVVRGRTALRAYWQVGLERFPDLHFEVIGVYTGVSTVVINYRNHLGRAVCEVLRFDGDLVREGHGTYLPAGGEPDPS